MSDNNNYRITNLFATIMNNLVARQTSLISYYTL
ncbi:hypothetical protein J2T02_000408 [Chitinophaga terrae (ex Kim and Jung 2007)]|nr:hypothetical protein [Chitinophaga terrae (ex Kim and Jung 2007)]